jgi:hypothetical protein
MLVGLLMTNRRTQPVLKSNVDAGAVRTPSLATALEGLRRAEQLVGPKYEKVESSADCFAHPLWLVAGATDAPHHPRRNGR